MAEGLLSLVTSRARAASIAGDLAEYSNDRGRLCFWVELACVSLALFSRGFNHAPWRSLWLFACGFGLWFFVYAVIRALGAVLGLRPLAGLVLDCSVASLSTYAYLALTLMLSNFVAGFIIGGRSRAGALNACTPLAMFWVAAALVAPVLESVSVTGTWYCTIVYLLGLPILYVAPLLYGGALAERRRSFR